MSETVNPKTLMGRTKLPMFSVVSPIALAHMAHAMRYGAFEALKKDGTRGYGPYNWREIAIEYSTYLDAAGRHIAQFADGEDYATVDSRVHHLGHAMATLGILLDAIEVGSAIDDRPKVGRGTTTRVMDRLKQIHAVGIDEPLRGLTASDVMALAATIPAPAPQKSEDYCTDCEGYGEISDPTEWCDTGCIACGGSGDGVVQRALQRGSPARTKTCHPADCDPQCPGPDRTGRGVA